MAGKNKVDVVRREIGWGSWGSGIQPNLSIGVNRHEIQVFEDGVLIQVFRSDIDQCKPVIESEARRYLKRMQEDNPDKFYKIKK